MRAKVDALRALQLETKSPARAAAVTDCRRYVDWATARVAGRRPMLLITSGLSGSGKTWLARRLAAHLGALHLRSDVERKRLAGLEAHQDSRSPPDAGIYTIEFNERTYGRLHECASAALAAGEPAIIDAAFLRREERRRFRTLAQERNLPFAIVHCRAPDAVLRDRVSARAAAFGDDEQRHVVAVDTSDDSSVAAAPLSLAALSAP